MRSRLLRVRSLFLSLSSDCFAFSSSSKCPMIRLYSPRVGFIFWRLLDCFNFSLFLGGFCGDEDLALGRRGFASTDCGKTRSPCIWQTRNQKVVKRITSPWTRISEKGTEQWGRIFGEKSDGYLQHLDPPAGSMRRCCETVSPWQ